MSRLAYTLPLALGEQIYAKAALDLVRANHEDIAIGLNWDQLYLRAPGYQQLVTEFSRLLFREPPYRFVEQGPVGGYVTIKELHEAGFRLAMPWFPELLCAPTAPIPMGPFLTLSTKVRFWGRPAFDFIKERLLDELARLSKTYTIVLHGERILYRKGEYEHWGPDAIYCIYDDLKGQFPYMDRTFDTYDAASFSIARIREDCTFMRDATCNINIGVGGSVALGASVGKVLAVHCCSGFPHIDALFVHGRNERVFMAHNANELYARLESL